MLLSARNGGKTHWTESASCFFSDYAFFYVKGEAGSFRVGVVAFRTRKLALRGQRPGNTKTTISNLGIPNPPFFLLQYINLSAVLCGK